MSVGGNATVAQGETFAGTDSFADPGTAGRRTPTVDYGDGSGDLPLALNPDKTFALGHTYTDIGATR